MVLGFCFNRELNKTKNYSFFFSIVVVKFRNDIQLDRLEQPLTWQIEIK